MKKILILVILSSLLLPGGRAYAMGRKPSIKVKKKVNVYRSMSREEVKAERKKRWDENYDKYKERTKEYWDIVEDENSTYEQKAEAQFKAAMLAGGAHFNEGPNTYGELFKMIKAYPDTKWTGYAAFNRLGKDGGGLEGLENDPWPEFYIDRYGQYIKKYPNNKYVVDALFIVGQATLAQAGYPEIVELDFAIRDMTEKEGQRQKILNWYFMKGDKVNCIPWIITKGKPVEKNQEKLDEAISIFNKIKSIYPNTELAKLSTYYLGIINEYCLGKPDKGLTYYKEFIKSNPENIIYLNKAKKLIELVKMK